MSVLKTQQEVEVCLGLNDPRPQEKKRLLFDRLDYTGVEFIPNNIATARLSSHAPLRRGVVYLSLTVSSIFRPVVIGGGDRGVPLQPEFSDSVPVCVSLHSTVVSPAFSFFSFHIEARTVTLCVL